MERKTCGKELWKVALIMTAMIMLLGGCGKKKTTIDLMDYTTVEFSGYDTEGYVTVNFDTGSLYSVLAQALCDNKTIGVVSVAALQSAYMTNPDVAALLDTIDSTDIWTVDKSSELTNGDNVTLTYNFDNEAFKDTGIVLQGETQIYSVSNLPEIETYDPFDGFAMKFTGTSPEGKATITDYPDELEQRDYELSSSDNLRNGDVITVTFNDPDEYGRRPIATEKEYTVSGLPEYITSVSQIPDTAWEKLKNEAIDVKTARVDYYDSWNMGGVYIDAIGDWATEIKDIYNWKWEKACLLYQKDTELGLFENRILLIYSFDTDENQGNVGAFYMDNLVLETDGTMLIPGGDMNYTTAYKGEDAFTNYELNSYAEEYEYEEAEIGWTDWPEEKSSMVKEKSSNINAEKTSSISKENPSNDNSDYAVSETSIEDTNNVGFYGIWISAEKSYSAGEQDLQETWNKGFSSAQLFLTTDWSNLNSKSYYVISCGTYGTKEAAEAALSSVQQVYPDAYVKYSGSYIGDWQNKCPW